MALYLKFLLICVDVTINSWKNKEQILNKKPDTYGNFEQKLVKMYKLSKRIANNWKKEIVLEHYWHKLYKGRKI